MKPNARVVGQMSAPVARDRSQHVELKVDDGTGAVGAGTLPQARGRVLVVDDDPMMATVVERSLVAYSVTVLHSGSEALALLTAGERFDAIVCDLMMPEMTGMQFYEQVLDMLPEQAQRFIFITGGSVTEAVHKFVGSVEGPVLEKPFNIDALRTLVGQVLRLGSPAKF